MSCTTVADFTSDRQVQQVDVSQFQYISQAVILTLIICIQLTDVARLQFSGKQYLLMTAETFMNISCKFYCVKINHQVGVKFATVEGKF